MEVHDSEILNMRLAVRMATMNGRFVLAHEFNTVFDLDLSLIWTSFARIALL
jgi:hypothetical protein